MAARLSGLDVWQRRLESFAELRATGEALRAEAEAIAAAARASFEAGRRRPDLAGSIEVIDESEATRPRFAVGTRKAAGWFLEFGTRRQRAAPWLGPSFRAALPGINHRLRNILSKTLKALGRA